LASEKISIELSQEFKAGIESSDKYNDFNVEVVSISTQGAMDTTRCPENSF
jgi:hypothetical protein